MKIGIYGGTFDPPHLGHMSAAKAAVRALGLERLLIIPAGIPPHKELSGSAAPAKDRFAMAELMADRLGLDIPVQVLDMELRREGKSYTRDTVLQLKEQYPADELWLLMGTDMFLSFHTWREPERIVKCVNLAVFARSEGDDAQAFADQSALLSQRFGAVSAVVENPQVVEISSTEVRQALAQGGGEDGLDESIRGYILTHHLYGTDAFARAAIAW